MSTTPRILLAATACLLFAAGAWARDPKPTTKIARGAVQLSDGVKDGVVAIARFLGGSTRKAAVATKDGTVAVKNGTAAAADAVSGTTVEGATRVARGTKAVGKGVKEGAKEIGGKRADSGKRPPAPVSGE
jgi:hypothetical protein